MSECIPTTRRPCGVFRLSAASLSIEFSNFLVNFSFSRWLSCCICFTNSLKSSCTLEASDQVSEGVSEDGSEGVSEGVSESTRRQVYLATCISISLFN